MAVIRRFWFITITVIDNGYRQFNMSDPKHRPNPRSSPSNEFSFSGKNYGRVESVKQILNAPFRGTYFHPASSAMPAIMQGAVIDTAGPV